MEVESFYESELDSDNDGYADVTTPSQMIRQLRLIPISTECPMTGIVDATEQQILDSTLILDDDDDNDGVTDEFDAFPYDAAASEPMVTDA